MLKLQKGLTMKRQFVQINIDSKNTAKITKVTSAEKDEIFNAYMSGNYCVYNEDKGDYHTDPRNARKMMDRAMYFDFIDISDPYFLPEVLNSKSHLDFRFLFINNPYPNGVFIKLQDLNKMKTFHSKISPVTCAEIYWDVHGLNIGIFHYKVEEGRKPLTLEASYLVYANGDLRTKFMRVKNQEVSETQKLFKTYLNKLHAFLMKISMYDLEYPVVVKKASVLQKVFN
jgi:hypothetical protein